MFLNKIHEYETASTTEFSPPLADALESDKKIKSIKSINQNESYLIIY